MTPVAFPQVDAGQIDAFVRALFRHADTGGYVQLRAFRDDAEGTWRPGDWPAPRINGDLANVVDAAVGFAGECAAAPEVVVFCPPVATLKDARHAAEKDIWNGVALSADCDRSPTQAWHTLSAILGPATIVAASGGEWTHPSTGEIQPKLHLHWRLSRPTRTFAEHVKLKEARRAAMALIGSDASGVPLVHPLRWPGSWHRKGSPRLATIIEHNADIEIDLDVALARLLEEARNRTSDEDEVESPATRGSEGHHQETSALITAILRGEDYHGAISRLAMRYLLGGMPDAQVVESLRGIMTAVDPGIRDLTGGTLHRDRWLSRYTDIPRAASSARRKLNEDQSDQTAQPPPEPLIEPNEASLPYPLDALPAIISAAVQEYRAYGQQPLSMVASSALAATSLASQGLADVARDAYLVGPISLNFLSVAGSGERKTSTDREFTRSLREWQTEKRDGMAGDAGQGRAQLAAWEAEKEGLLGKIKASGGKKAIGEEADIKDWTIRLSELEKNKPPAVIMPSLFYEDINAETLAVRLAEGWPSASLWSDEGGIVIGSGGMSDENLMKFVALLNRLWDGHPFERERLTAKSARLSGRRFTVSLMMQPIVLTRLLGACNGAARNMGFVARNLLSWPASTIGDRLYREPPADKSASNKFNARIRALLDMELPKEEPHNALTPTRLTLAAPAKREWTAFFNDIERELRHSGEFGDVVDIGSKIAENAARVAGMFHVFEHGPGGEIGKTLIEGGIAVVAWHLSEARRVVSANRKPEDIADAELLLECFRKEKPIIGNRRDILRLGPPRLREDKNRRNRALQILLDRYWLLESGTPPRLILNPKARVAS
jgi:hypothetical protein